MWFPDPYVDKAERTAGEPSVAAGTHENSAHFLRFRVVQEPVYAATADVDERPVDGEDGFGLVPHAYLRGALLREGIAEVGPKIKNLSVRKASVSHERDNGVRVQTRDIPVGQRPHLNLRAADGESHQNNQNAAYGYSIGGALLGYHLSLSFFVGACQARFQLLA
jgi:hypothetical protein